MAWRVLFFLVCATLAPLSAWAENVAEEKLVQLYAPPALVETGVFDYILPRFSLKTQVRVNLQTTPQEADMVLGHEGAPVFAGMGQNWAVEVLNTNHKGTARLAGWLQSDVGQRTVASYAPEGAALFGPPEAVAQRVVTLELTGDPALGLHLSRAKCTRCHTVDAETSWSSIGSTPSFAVLRSLPDWQTRFVGFYALAPHPAFMMVPGVTPPFPKNRPSPIVPVKMTLDELDHVLAYVAGMAPADLGAPLLHQ